MGIFDQYDFNTGKTVIPTTYGTNNVSSYSPLVAMPASPVSNVFGNADGVNSFMQSIGAYGQGNLNVQGSLNAAPTGWLDTAKSFLPENFSWFPTKDAAGNVTGGQGMALMGAIQGFGNMWLGNSTLKQSINEFNTKKDLAYKTYAMQKNDFNSRLFNKANSRGLTPEDLKSYMSKYEVA